MESKMDELLRRINEAERELDQATAAWRREAKQARDQAVRFSKIIRDEP